MANPVWTGTLSFGLVAVGLRLFPARERREGLRQFVKGTSDRVRNQRVNERSGAPVEPEEIVTGAEYGRQEQYVLLEAAELEGIQPVRSKTLPVESFIDSGSVDALWYDATYYAAPDKGADKAYALLYAALSRTGRAGLGRMILSQRERLVLITPQQGVLTASTLYWPDEIRDPADVMRPPAADTEVDPEQLDLALKLADDAMALDWAPQEYEDAQQRRFEELIEAKAAGRTISYEREEAPQRGTVVDLDEALRRSVKERMDERRARQAGRDAGLRGDSRGSPRATKKELLARAQELGVPGRSRMSRDELATAVEHAAS